MGNGGPVTGWLIHNKSHKVHRVQECSCTNFFPMQSDPFAKTFVIMQIVLSYEFSTSVAGSIPRGDRTTKMSSFSMYTMANGF